MLMSVISSLIVSVDAFFIGLSLGLQKKCKFLYLAVINIFLFVLCMIGFFVAGQVYEVIPINPDIVVGLAFILMGLWYILCYFIGEYKKRRSINTATDKHFMKQIVIIGLVMSGEAMLITMGITLVFMPYSTVVIPVTVALAHFGYSALSFCIARTKQVKRIPVALSSIISGVALIVYGLMALFL